MPSGHRPGAPRVLVYGRDGCHLCEDAEAVVHEVCTVAGVAWAKVAIDEDPTLSAAYGELIPVITVDGREIAHYRLAPQTLARALGS